MPPCPSGARTSYGANRLVSPIMPGCINVESQRFYTGAGGANGSSSTCPRGAARICRRHACSQHARSGHRKQFFTCSCGRSEGAVTAARAALSLTPVAALVSGHDTSRSPRNLKEGRNHPGDHRTALLNRAGLPEMGQTLALPIFRGKRRARKVSTRVGVFPLTVPIEKGWVRGRLPRR